MMRLVAAAALLILAGCGASGPLTDQQACERQANEDPAVKAMIMKGAGSETFRQTNRDALAAAKQDATVACLRARGLVRPGGVERQKPLS